MKRFLLCMILAVSATGIFAQTANCVLFTENGERFTVILNGLKANEIPQTNVKIESLNAETYKLKVIFDDPTLPAMDKTLYVMYGNETTYAIALNNKNEYKLKPISQVPIAQAPATPASTQVIMWGTSPTVVSGGTTTTTVTQQTTTTTSGVNTNVSGGGESVNMNMNVSENGMGTSVSGGGTSVNMGVNVSENGMNMNFNVNEGTAGSSTAGTTTTTTTTTTSSSSSGTVTPGTNPCGYGMDASGFQSAKSSISAKSFEDSKLTVAKQILNSNCLTSAQVKEVMQLFTFEETKLDYAKFAYGRTVDPNNYFMLNDAFEFESSIEELDAYIQGR